MLNNKPIKSFFFPPTHSFFFPKKYIIANYQSQNQTKNIWQLGNVENISSKMDSKQKIHFTFLNHKTWVAFGHSFPYSFESLLSLSILLWPRLKPPLLSGHEGGSLLGSRVHKRSDSPDGRLHSVKVSNDGDCHLCVTIHLTLRILVRNFHYCTTHSLHFSNLKENWGNY